MLRSCSYCGRIHDASYDCPDKIARLAELRRMQNDRRRAKRAGGYEYRFRQGAKWSEKSKQIRARDNYLCLCCQANLMGTDKQIHSDAEGDLQVHHIIPVSENKELRLDETNLITVCAIHHELCESGKITRQQQSELVQQSIQKAQAGRTDAM